ncbi:MULTISPECIES: macrolide 2'-phosphotransferase [Paenibacillus]|uniref:macrolide 2'-phosphotransferase n=1 Tax=Paenibacillus TaxID=44249 RepID=UPI002FE03B08
MTYSNSNGISNENAEAQLISDARRHGLNLERKSLELNETGMDFLVGFAKDVNTGRTWVLRKPRREDVWERAVNERNVLNLLHSKLSVAVPDWRMFSPELIAYPLLPGNPVAAVDPVAGGYAWAFEQDQLTDSFFDSLAGALADLHRIDREAAAAAGLRVKTPQEARQGFADHIREISAHFTVPEPLETRWKRWLSTDSYWPDFSVLIHGDLHPPHILVDENQRVTGLIDWTEAEVADPGKDFTIYYALFGREGLEDLLGRYERYGGRTWPRMSEHIAEQWAAYPALVAKFALTTGREQDMEMAAGMLTNWKAD